MSHDLYQETIPFDEGDSAHEPQSLADNAGSAKGAVKAKAGARRVVKQTSQEAQRGDSPKQADGGLPCPGDKVGHYELIRELGRGGMGVVYLARDLKLARRVAIKFIHARHARIADRFIAEARVTARCHHENIVIVHDIGEHDGNPYMVLEYLRGRTLRELSNTQALTPERAIELIIPVVRALKHAHAHGIVHRDLKPSNILVTEFGAVKVLDFGIAKAFAGQQVIDAASEYSGAVPTIMPPLPASEPTRLPAGKDAKDAADAAGKPNRVGHPGHTKTGALMGTLPYMSPEQLCDSADVDGRTDIWAIGIILCELLLGRHPLGPLHAGALESVAELDEPMPPANTLVPHVGKLGHVIDRCLVKHRRDRLASAAELLADLKALAAHHDPSRSASEDNPFTGLAAFQKADADRFFGRTRAITSVVAQVQSQPLVTLVGPSGSGKSSLVRAGVIPALERAGEGWHALVVRPGLDPLTALSTVLGELNVHSSTDSGSASNSAEMRAPTDNTITPSSGRRPTSMRLALAERLQAEPGWLGYELRSWAQRKRRRVLLFVDQFEEIYTLVAANQTRTAFLRCLQGAADDASSPVRIVLAIRSDFLDRVVEDGQFMNEVTRGLVMVPPLDRDGLRDALTKPVEAAGYHFESAELVEEMLAALDGTAGALPLLQFAASKLWELRDASTKQLTRMRYQSFGGIAGALVVHGDAVLASLSSVRLGIARSIFERLVTPERTRAVATLGELRELPGDPDTIEQVIHYLADARLLAIESASGSRPGYANAAQPSSSRHQEDEIFSSGVYLGADSSTVELIHESLIDGWPVLRRWLDEYSEDNAFIVRLRVASQQWLQGGKRDGMLWTGGAAQEAQRWRERYHGELGEREGMYLAAVLAQFGRKERIKRLSIIATIVFLALLLVIASVGFWRIREAEHQATHMLGQLREALYSETQLRAQAQSAQRKAEQAQAEAERAKAEVEKQAALTRNALEQAETARDEARSAAQEARQSEFMASRARAKADAQTARAEEERAKANAEKERAEAEQAKARAEAEDKKRIIERSIGEVKRDLN